METTNGDINISNDNFKSIKNCIYNLNVKCENSLKSCSELTIKYEQSQKKYEQLEQLYNNLEIKHNNLQIECNKLKDENVRTLDMHMTNGSNLMTSCNTICNQKSYSSKLFYLCWTIYMYHKYLSTIINDISNNSYVKLILCIINHKYGISFETLWKNYLIIKKKFKDFYDFLERCCTMLIEKYAIVRNNSNK